MKPIGDRQTETGIKDKLSSAKIAAIILRFNEEKLKKDGRSGTEISAELELELRGTEKDFMNPLLTMPGKKFCFFATICSHN